MYKRDLPSKLRPAHVRMLLNDGLIDETSLCATLVDLIDKGYIDIIREDKQIYFIKTSKNCEGLLEFEKFLMKWIFEKYGDSNKVSAKQISYSLNNDIYNEKPCKIFNYFQNRVWISFPLNRYYKDVGDNNSRIIYLLLLIVGFFQIMYIWSIPMVICGLGGLLFASPSYVLNDRGIEEKDNWLDFRRHLIDFSNIKDKTTEMVKIWNFYLTYSIALDIDSISSREIKEIFKDDIYNSFKSSGKYVDQEILKKDNFEKKIIPELEIDGTIEKEVLEERKKYNLD